MIERVGAQPQPSAYDAAVDLLLAHESFVLTTHRDPDGDGLGGEAALAAALRQLGKQCRIINDGAVPPQYAFLGQQEEFEPFRRRAQREAVQGADAVVVLDAARPERTGRASLAIDHHPHAGGWAAVDLNDAEACAATELVHDLIERLPVELTPWMAGALYTGIVADTQGFRTANITPRAHRRAAALIEAGAPVSVIHEGVFGSWRPDRQRLLGHFLGSLRLIARGQIAWGTVERATLQRFHQPTSATEGFVEEALAIAGVDLAIVFLEETDAVRVSFRSRHGVRVDRLARDLGGGGHGQAAGSRIPCRSTARFVECFVRQDSRLGSPPPAHLTRRRRYRGRLGVSSPVASSRAQLQNTAGDGREGRLRIAPG
jgi:bifunctional oligoribonuclease and PAP phosphatase NrnA